MQKIQKAGIISRPVLFGSSIQLAHTKCARLVFAGEISNDLITADHKEVHAQALVFDVLRVFHGVTCFEVAHDVSDLLEEGGAPKAFFQNLNLNKS